ncbi:MAG: choice-of-anchor D domain-containing protein, partial [Acidobacteriia bacterium]|nr:choice-of-anchor D domain-containing protein [Terriglobia bacterium]
MRSLEARYLCVVGRADRGEGLTLMKAVIGKMLALASTLVLALPGSAAAASASPASVNFGSVPINTTASRDITITVDAGFSTAIASGSGLNAPFSFDFSTCGAGGGFTGPGTCTVTEHFTPTSAAAANGTLTVFECPVAGGSCVPISIPVSGTGVSTAAANPPGVAFGNVPINTSVSQAVTITVDAGYRTEIASGSGLNAPFAFDFDTCGAGGGFTGPGTCTVTQHFAPTAAAASNGTTTVFECPVVGGSCLPIPYTVSGTGVVTAVANPPGVAFGNVPINTTVSQSVTLTVDAGYRAEIASGSGLNAPFSFDFSTCGAGGGFTGPGTCTVTQHFSPTAAVASNGTTTVFECPVIGGSCIPIPYTVNGTGGSVAAANPPSVDFGNVPINTTVTQSVTITVDAGYRTEIASGSGLNAPFSFDFDTCGAAGGFTGPGTCTVAQHFTPTAAAVSNGSTTVFECPVIGGSCLPIPYAVSGTGIVTAAANPASVAFGNVPINTMATQSVTITVDAGYRTEIASGSGLNAPFSFEFDACGAGGGFAGPGTCTVVQHFTPAAAATSNGSTTVFECPVIGGSCIPIPYTVSGTGVVTAVANPASVAFGNVSINTTAMRSVTITVDAGYRTEIASGSGLNAPFSFDFDTCGASGGFTGPGTCTVVQHFTPTAAATSNGSTTVFECPVVGGSCIPIPYTVSGTGVSTRGASPASVDFGSVPINTTVTQSVTITADAGYRVEIASGSGLNVPFSFDFDTCGAGGGFTGPGTCTVAQHFSPTAEVASNGTTTVFECPIVGGSCLGIPYDVTGTGISTRAASPAGVNFGNVPINTTVAQPVTITVDTGYRVEIASGSGINVPFGFDFSTCGAGGGFAGPGTCAVTQSFSPTAVALSTGTTTVFECPVIGGSCLGINIAVSGTGVSIRAANPVSVNFGDVPIGTTATQSVMITADAGYRIELASGSGINVPFSFAFDTCGAGGGFAGPGTCSVSQSFSPTAVGPAIGTTTVFECPVIGGSCLGIPYTVTGNGVSTRGASPANVDFGSVPINTTATHAVTITVDMGYRVELASGSGINVPFGFDFDTCGAGGGFTGPGTCAVAQHFTPTAEAAGSCLPIPYDVAGTGISTRAADPASVAFGNVPINTTAGQLVTLTVDAGYRIEIASGSGINVPFGFAFDACGAGGGFAGPGTCTVQQSFTPAAVTASSGTTTIFECPVIGGSCLGINVSVSGTGVSVRAANPASVNFGNVTVGTTASQAVALTVDTGYRIELASGSGINVPFGFSFDACGAGGGFAGPGTCAVQQSFTPAAIGPASGTTTVFECPVAGGSCLGIDIAVGGSGVSARAANPASVNFG